MARRAALAFALLALLAAAAASVYLLTAPFYSVHSVDAESGIATAGTRSLVEGNGLWAVVLLGGVNIMAAAPLALALQRSAVQALLVSAASASLIRGPYRDPEGADVG